MADNTPIPITNPLQNNNMALIAIGYFAATLANKFPIFDSATWNYIILSVGGVLAIGAGGIINRKGVVIATVANMKEVKNEGGIVLDKSVPGATALAAAAPDNVVAK